MKKRTGLAVLLALTIVMTFMLCACGGAGSGGQNGSSNAAENKAAYTIDDLLGKWHSAEAGEVLTIQPGGAEIWLYSGPFTSSISVNTTIDGDTVEFSGIGKFSIEEGKLTCLETDKVAKDTVFLKVEEDICKPEDLYGEWISVDGKKTLEISDTGISSVSDAGVNTVPEMLTKIAGNTLYAINIDKYEIVKDDAGYRLNGKEEFVLKGSEAAVASSQSKYLTVDGIYLDQSYEDKDSDSIKLLYLFYTVTSDDQNMKIDCKSANLSFGTNAYQSTHIPHSCRYMPSYYYKDYLKDVYVGDSVKFVETFKIPQGELSEGKIMTLSKSQVPDATAIQLNASDVVICEDVEEIAEQADQEGYEEELDRLSPADEETERAVKNAINGYKWDFYVNTITYAIEFWDPDNFELRVPALGTANGGTYEVLNGYVRCTYDDSDNVVEIPWEWGSDDIDLKVTDGFDVKAN